MEILTAAWVVTDKGPLEDGRVAVDDGRVAWVGAPTDAGAPDGPLRDLGPGVLLPGLVNAHCHLELSHLAGRVSGERGFVPWVEALVAERGQHSEAEIRAAAERAIRGLEAGGTVAVGDVSNTLVPVDLLRASRLAAVVFFELLAWDPARADAVLVDAEGRVSAIEGPEEDVVVKLAAHAPHSVSPELFAGLVERGGPAALHLAESPAEKRFLADGGGDWPGFLARRGLGHVRFEPPRRSPVAYAEELGILGPHLLAAHVVQVDRDDCARLARSGTQVVLCPRSNAALGVGPAPVPDLLAAGVPLSLGSDSLASAPTLDVLDDAIALHRAFPALDPEGILEMATAGGAAALGLSDLGRIAPGQRAALVVAAADRRPRDPYRFLLSGEARLQRVET
jgi:cytosine/adenosine deaminase-related metal-dependent hydrolase